MNSELVRIRNEIARIQQKQSKLTLEYQYWVAELLKLARRGGEGVGKCDP